MKPLCIVSCPIDTFSGYGARSRDFVKALIKVKGEEWDIKILPQRWGNTPQNYLSKDDPIRKRFINTLTPQTQPDIWFQITIPSEFQPIGKAYNIGVTAGIESTLFPPDWIEGVNRMNLTLLSSNHSLNILQNTNWDKIDSTNNQKVGIIKLEKQANVLFEGLNLDTYFKIQKPKSVILKDIPEDFCFLFTGHWLSGNLGEDRKNVSTLVDTFCKTFKNSRKKPALVLKCNIVNYSILDREQVIKQIQKITYKIDGELPNIYLLHGEMTNEEMNLLNNDPKVKSFVSFTKGEGFGRPLLEAAITGKPVITTNWSGHIDFIKPDYNILIGGELKNVHESAANDWIRKDSQWFNINTDIAGRALKDMFKHYKKYIKSSRKQTQYLKENWSSDKMAEVLNGYLPTIEPAPQHTALKLPKLKKVGQSDTPKLKLPKLKKVEA